MITILQGDWIEQLRTLPNESVQCCVTSPPYWGLRDYGTATWEAPEGANIASTIDWRACDHKQFNAYPSGLEGGKEAQDIGKLFKDTCGKCGAKRIDAQLGLEKTPEEYVAKMVTGFREVRRVLRGDGTLWLNLGDSYNGQGAREPNIQANGDLSYRAGGRAINICGLKPKDLVGIPWMVAFALRADGWWLRSDIIWAKLNPMPESVTDRPTKSHEYIFLLSKSARYYYDAAAIREPASDSMLQQVAEGYGGASTKLFEMAGAQNGSDTKARIINGARAKIDKQRGHSRRHDGFNDRWDHLTKEEQCAIGSNKRSVWTVATAPYPDAHFATYPPALVKPCILAGSKPGDTILDPFGGSGTTGMVAVELGRRALLIELNPAYIKLIRQRCDVTAGLAL